MSSHKEEIISFKADGLLANKLRSVPNRSDFIRNAILSALGNACPLCGGSGRLSEGQRLHWERFAEHHGMRHCDSCEEFYISCDASGTDPAHPRKEKA